MPIIYTDNPLPEVGQLIFKEYASENGSFQSASLAFVDEAILEGKPWMYTEVALMEDFGNEIRVYNGFESGGMPPKYTRIATDEDITKFLRLIKDGKVTEGSKDFLSWLKDINSDQVLLAKEKERINRLSAL